MKRPSRSSKYQYIICEAQVGDEILEIMPNSKSIYHSISPYKYNEELLDLKEELLKQIHKLAKKILTNKQYQIYLLTLDGYTQTEIAKIMGVNQSSVSKSAIGSQSYENSKRYGGFLAKLRKSIAESFEIQKILAKMELLKEEKL